jgi:ABC-type Fe3+ transport system permease subunit
LAVVVALPVGWLARRSRPWAITAIVIVVLCVSLPGPLVGLAVIEVFNQEWFAIDNPFYGPENPFAEKEFPIPLWLYDRTITAMVPAILVRCLPIALLVAWFSMKSVPQETLDSAASEGADSFDQFWLVALPQRWLALPISWLAAFALASGDLTASILVAPPGVSTVPIRVFGMIHAGVIHEVASLSLTSAVGFTLVAAVIHWLVGRAATSD